MSVLARRSLLQQLIGAAPAQVAADTEVLAAPDPVMLLLNRISFGPRQSEVTLARASGFEAWLEAQLDYTRIDDSAIESAISANLPTVSMSNLQILTSYGPQTRMQFQALGELRAATILRQLYSPRQLFEVMVEFWNNHFSVQHTDGLVQQFKTSDDRAIRANAMGKFRDLVNANARSPAMLYFLDNYTNSVTGPNENYARELLELHTLGVNGGYTEDDVKAAARAMTGWTFDRRTYEFSFNLALHDRSEKVVLGTQLAAGRGIEDGQELIDMLVVHPATAAFIASKLVRRFVADVPPQSLIDKVAESFRISDGDIRTMLRTLFYSEEFLASADAKARRPAEFLIGALRVTEATLTGDTYFRALTTRLDAFGQTPFMWATPDGYPDEQDYWFNTSAWINRWNYGFALAEGNLDRGVRVDVNALAGSARTPTALVDALAERLLRRSLTRADREALISYAGNGRAADAPLNATETTARARELTGILLGSRYFNYR